MSEAIQTTPSGEMTARARYETLAKERLPYERRAEDAASVTIPALCPPQGSTGATDLPTPFQSVGARGVNNLASKMLLVLFPPGSSFFRLTMDDFVVEELKQANGGGDTQEFKDARAEFEEALATIERAVVNRLEQRGARTQLFELLKHLVASGNGLLYVKKDGALKFYPLRKYVVKRDLEGNVLEVVVKETVDRMALPQSAREIVDLKRAAETGRKDETTDKCVDIFTRVSRTESNWTVHQEVEGVHVPGTNGTYPLDKCAWLPLRFIAVDGEDYGRGYVEEYQGDLFSLEKLEQALTEAAGIAAKHIFLVNEGGVTSKKKLAESASGDIIDGDAKDVTVLGVEKQHDMAVTERQAAKVEARLEQAFMLSSSIQRNAERVTAEEIRYMAGELEQALGGVYSVLSQELQAPLAKRVMHQMTVSRDIPRLPDKTVAPQIVTGLEGLGRSSDLTRLDLLVSGTSQIFGPEAVAEYVSVGAYMQRRAAALSIDIKGIVRSEDEVAKSRQQAQQAALAEKAVPAGVKLAGDVARQQQAQTSTQPTA